MVFSQDVGCFSKGAGLPLVLTTPFIANVRESLLHAGGTSHNDGQHSSKFFALQREERVALSDAYIESVVSIANSSSNSNALASIHPPAIHGQGNYISELLPFRSHYRTKKQTRRDVKASEKEEKRRKAEMDERRRKRTAEFSKAVMLHRDDFFRFHKGKRAGKCALINFLYTCDNV